MSQCFQNLQDNSQIDNYLTGKVQTPKSAQVKEASKAAVPSVK